MHQKALTMICTELDGKTEVIELTRAELESLKEPFPVRADLILEIEIEDPTLPIELVLKSLDLVPGDFDVDTSINAEKREELDPDGDFGEWDTWYEDHLWELPFTQRFVSLYHSGETFWIWWLEISKGGLIPLLVTPEGIVNQRILAKYSWFTESGAPITWWGGARLMELPGNLSVEIVFGDVEESSRVTHTDGTDEAKVRELANFCLTDERVVDAALSLEGPIPPSDSPELSRVSALLDSYQEFVQLEFSPEFANLDTLRETLASRSFEYRRIRDFLRDPLADENTAIIEALAEFRSSGVISDFNGIEKTWL